MVYDPSKDPNHVHKYTFVTTKNVFEMIPGTQERPMYDMIEYAYLYCQCTHTVKVPVKMQNEFPDEVAD